MTRIVGKWSSLSNAKKSAIAFMVASYIHYAISFLVTPLFSRLLSTSEFGLVTTFNSWISIMGPIATLSLYAGFFNIGMLDFESSRDRFESSLVGLSWVSAALSMIVFTVIQIIFPQVIDMPFSLTILMALYFLTYPATRYWQARERFDYKYKKLFICTLVMAVLTPLVGLAFVLLSRSISPANDLGMARLVGTNLVSIISGIGFCVFIISKGKSVYDWTVWKTALTFCIPLIPHYLAMHILSASDKVMINSLIGSSEAGVYGMAYTASMVITTAWTAIQGSLSPFVLKNLQKKNYSQISRVSTLCIGAFSILCFAVCVVAPEIIMILGGHKYVDSIRLIPPLIAAVLFMEMYNLFSMVEFYHKKTTAIMFATMGAALLNVVLNVICIQVFGYEAAAYTTLVCYIVYCTFHYINMRKIEPAKIYNLKLLITISFIYIVACFACLMVYDHPVLRYGLVLILFILTIINRKKIVTTYKNLASGRR